MLFYPGLHKPWQARHLPRAFISINRLRSRRKPIACADWIMDSGAFTELERHGCYRHGTGEYAELANAIAAINPGLRAIVSQDWMCEAWMLEKTGLTIEEHQRRTIERYDALLRCIRGVYLLPVLQGFAARQYVEHLDQYGDRLGLGAWVGVGTLCKRNGRPAAVEHVLAAIRKRRPDLKLHAFGLKKTALGLANVRDALYSADSMAWSFAARWEGRNGNDWREARAFADRIERQPVQTGWSFD